MAMKGLSTFPKDPSSDWIVSYMEYSLDEGVLLVCWDTVGEFYNHSRQGVIIVDGLSPDSPFYLAFYNTIKYTQFLKE